MRPLENTRAVIVGFSKDQVGLMELWANLRANLFKVNPKTKPSTPHSNWKVINWVSKETNLIKPRLFGTGNYPAIEQTDGWYDTQKKYLKDFFKFCLQIIFFLSKPFFV
jgi:hypothetical protein